MLQEKITEKTSAILATHVFGNPCDIKFFLPLNDFFLVLLSYVWFNICWCSRIFGFDVIFTPKANIWLIGNKLFKIFIPFDIWSQNSRFHMSSNRRRWTP